MSYHIHFRFVDRRRALRWAKKLRRVHGCEDVRMRRYCPKRAGPWSWRVSIMPTFWIAATP